MNIISHLLEKKMVPVIIISFLAFLTLGTSVLGAVKVAGSVSDGKPQDSQVLEGTKTEQENSIGENSKNTAKINSNENSKNLPKTSGVVKNSANGKLVNNPTQASNMLGSQNSLSTNSNVNPNACIITIFGKQYDVTSLRSSHPGGDVFVCGADQSATYQSVHGTSVSRLAKYLVTTGSGGSNPTNPGTGVGGSQNGTSSQQSGLSASRNRKSDDDNDDEMEDQDDNDNELGGSDD